MKSDKTIKVLFPLFCTVMLLAGALLSPALAEGPTDLSALYKSKDIQASWSESDATAVDLGSLSEPLVITGAGDYVLSGETQYPVVITAAETDDVRLILQGVTIASASGPAILEQSADKLILTLAENTVNTLSDQTTLPDGADTIAAAIYAEDDLSVNGSGTLVIHGTAGHGIQSKSDLIIADGSYEIHSAKDAIRGRNSVLILNGTVAVSAQGDGIASTRDNRDEKGWVVIAGGSVTVTTGKGAAGVDKRKNATADSVSRKGIKAATDLTILGGDLSLDCEDDGLHAVNIMISGGSLRIRSGDDAIQADASLSVTAGTPTSP